MAQGADGRRRARAHRRGEALLGLRYLVERFGAGVRRLRPAGISGRRAARAARDPGAGARARASRAQAAALRAFGEGLDDGRLIGILFLVDVDGQPLPQVLPPAAPLVLGPCDGFSVGAAGRRKTDVTQRGPGQVFPVVGGYGAWIGKDFLCSIRK